MAWRTQSGIQMVSTGASPNFYVEVTVPGGMVTDDVLIAFVSARYPVGATVPTVTTPSGWTLIDDTHYVPGGSEQGVRMYSFWRVAPNPVDTGKFRFFVNVHNVIFDLNIQVHSGRDDVDPF